MARIPRLRFAPSPTGFLHLGGLRTALFNHVMARKLGGEWVLRIEDTDRACLLFNLGDEAITGMQARLVEGSVDDIRRSLQWAGIEYNHGPGIGGPHSPYIQSERLDLYHKYANKLLDSGQAYRCFCGPDRLADTKKKLQSLGSNSTYDRACLNLTEEETARRVRAGKKHIVRLNSTMVNELKPKPDLIFGTSVQHTRAGLPTDPVLLKTDLFPTYHLASIVDDHEMEITHVLRGEEWLPTLPLHLDLYAALGLEPPRFGHLPLLLNPDGTKMSKRKGDVRVRDYMEKGWEAEAVINWLALAGWNVHQQLDQLDHKHDLVSGAPKLHQDVLTLSELIESFDISHLTHRRTILDPKKLEFLNRQHVARKIFSPSAGEEDVVQRAAHMIREAYPGIDPQYYSKEYITDVCRALSDRLVTLDVIKTAAPYFFVTPDYTSDAAKSLRKTVQNDLYSRVLEQALEGFKTVSLQDEQVVRAALEKIQSNLGIGTVKVMNSIRHALTGQKAGPSVVEILRVLGWDRTRERLNAALKYEAS
ncbi:glutamyl-tRNA synthetase [Ceratobasidium sp. AG-Ba]|nr:glutamyl-tRNA synthetase [Ceratobasidium sp. AG-Ba]QRV91762.1 glutamyl-tRNA synthetase [Ceratobasidium sp. AG-Ba]